MNPNGLSAGCQGLARAYENEVRLHAETRRQLEAVRATLETERRAFRDRDLQVQVSRLTDELAATQAALFALQRSYDVDVAAARKAERDELAERVVTNLRLTVIGLFKE